MLMQEKYHVLNQKNSLGIYFWGQMVDCSEEEKNMKIKWKKRNITTPNIRNEDMETEGTKLRTKEYLLIRSHKRITHFSTLIFFWNFLFHSYFLVIPTFSLAPFSLFFLYCLASFYSFTYLPCSPSFFSLLPVFPSFILSILTVFSPFLLYSLCP